MSNNFRFLRMRKDARTTVIQFCGPKAAAAPFSKWDLPVLRNTGISRSSRLTKA